MFKKKKCFVVFSGSCRCRIREIHKYDLLRDDDGLHHDGCIVDTLQMIFRSAGFPILIRAHSNSLFERLCKIAR